MSAAVANRYARALADVVGAEGRYREALAELDAFAAVYEESAELREVFDTPAVPELRKLKVLDVILHRLGTSLPVGNFLRVLVAHYRMNMFPEMCQAFHRIANGRLGVVQVGIASAARLSDAQQERMRARFRELLRSQVELEFEVQPDLVGGVRAQVGSTVYDGSVREELDRIQQQLIAG